MLNLDFARNTRRMNVASPMIDILQRRHLLQNHLLLNLAMMKSKILPWRNTLQREVPKFTVWLGNLNQFTYFFQAAEEQVNLMKLLYKPICISAINICGTTVHSGLGIKPDKS